MPMTGDAPRLRPMDIASLLDSAFALYRRHFALLAGIAVILGVPESIINALISALTFARTATTSSTGSLNIVSFRSAAPAGTGIVGVAFGAIITGAIAYAVARIYLGEPVTVESAYRGVGMRGFLRLIGAILLGALIGILLFLIPAVLLIVGIVSGFALLDGVAAILFFAAALAGLYLFVMWQFVPQAIVVEGHGVVDAFRRSWHLVEGTWWRVFGIYLVLSIMVGILGSIVGGIAGGILAVSGGDRGAIFLAQLIAQFVTVLITPFQLCAMTLLFFDLRVRKEGFDLEQMVRAMDEPTTR
jgi:hypothetical protein